MRSWVRPCSFLQREYPELYAQMNGYTGKLVGIYVSR